MVVAAEEDMVMGIEKQHGHVIFICDECGDDFNTDETDFLEALQAVKDEGWLVQRNNEDTEWMHICNECASGRMG